MTDAGALEQARARWGTRAVIHTERTVLADGAVIIVHTAGRMSHDAHAWAAFGRGHTWAAAFTQADHHEHRSTPP